MDDLRTELETLVNGEDSHERAELREVVEAVLAAGVQSRHALAARVLDRDAGVLRDHAYRLLRLMNDDLAQQTWLALLNDPDPIWRSQAMNGLDLLGRASSATALIAVLRADPVAHVRGHAAIVLGTCAPASEEALELLLAILGDATEPPHIRGSAAEALHRYADVRAANALVSALEDPEPEVRYYTAFALAARNDAAALPALERAAAIEQAVLPAPLGPVRDEILASIEHIRYRQRRG